PDGGARPDTPPAASPTVRTTDSPTPSGTGRPVTGRKVLLTTQVEARGGEPQIPYVFDGAINLPDGSQVPVSADYSQVAALGDGWVAVRDGFVDRLDATGSVTASEPGSGPLAVTADGSIVVYTTPEGALMSLSAGAEPLAVTAAADAVPSAVPVGVLGSGTCQEGADGDGCTVYYNDPGQRPRGLLASSHGITERVGDLLSVGGVARDGRVDGIVSVTDQGSCSVMLEPNGDVAWRTCAHTLGAFSPDGRLVLGHPAYRDGIGDGSLAILDAVTGAVLVDYVNDATTQAFLHTAVWDADGTVLATVFARGSWSLMRMTSQGDLSNVSGGGLAGGSDETSPPLAFAARP
ncbi:MAG: hypothetical protein WB798_04420, partial [Nocardioidaceae bacterium]